MHYKGLMGTRVDRQRKPGKTEFFTQKKGSTLQLLKLFATPAGGNAYGKEETTVSKKKEKTPTEKRREKLKGTRLDAI